MWVNKQEILKVTNVVSVWLVTRPCLSEPRSPSAKKNAVLLHTVRHASLFSICAKYVLHLTMT